MSRRPTTGRFDTREELIEAVYREWFHSPRNLTDIARYCRVSTSVVNKILNTPRFTWDADEDVTLSAEQLDDKYNPEGDGEHPFFQRCNWRQAVRQEETLCGYWDWVTHQVFELVNDDDRCPHGMFYSGAGSCPLCGK